MVCSRNKKLISAAIVGLGLGLLGSVFIYVWPIIFDSIMYSKLQLTPNSMSFKFWEELPIPIYISFYMFNWTNFDNLTAKPVLVEMGPYVFSEHRVKRNLTWNDNNQTITYYQNRTWTFEPGMSGGSLDDVVTTLNVPALAATYSCRDSPKYIKLGLNLLLDLFRTTYYVHKPVRELLFDGYEDKILSFAEHLPPGWLPNKLPFDKFGWFYTRNGSVTYDGRFNMQTGARDVSQLGVLSNWQYSNHTTFYPSDCGSINGSAGEMFAPKQQKTSIELFSTDICRTLSLVYKEEAAFDGIRGYRFWADDQMFANETTDPDNWCFCGEHGDGDGGRSCYPNGVLNVTACKWGAPVFVSLPHFYHGDATYRDAVIGMHPVPDHQTFVDLEPLSGLPLQVEAALQINVLLQPMQDYSLLKDMPTIFFPAFWFRQSVRLNADMTAQVKGFLFLSHLGSILSYVFLGLGLSTLLVALVVRLSRLRRDDDSLYLVNNGASTPSVRA